MEKLSLSGTLAHVAWSHLRYDYRNAVDYSASARYSVIPALEVTGGFYRRNLQREWYGGDDSSTFFTGGIRCHWKRLGVWFIVSDSHSFSAVYNRYTLVQTGIEYSFR